MVGLCQQCLSYATGLLLPDYVGKALNLLNQGRQTVMIKCHLQRISDRDSYA